MRRIIMAMGVIALFLNASCETKTTEHETEGKLLVTNPLKKDTLVTREYVSQISAISHIELRALEKGYLQNIYVDEGQFVKKGQLMFKIMPLILEAEQKKAEAEANFAQIEFQNTKSLSDSNVVSKNELALAKARLDKANAELGLANTHVGFTEIRAPFDGIMDRFQVRLGSLIEEGDLLTTLSDNSKMWVYFNVPEAEYLDYKTSTEHNKPFPVRLKMANHQLFEYPGIVETIQADFNNETGNIAFRATFPNPKNLLRHGQTGNVQASTLLNEALLIPQKATFEVLEKKFVFVVDKDKTVHTREITIGATMPDLYVVTDGLSENEHILIEGIRKVKENEKIDFNFEDPQTVISKLKVYSE